MIFILGEGVLIYCAVALASFFLLDMDMGIQVTLDEVWLRVLLVAVITQLSLYFNDLYEFKTSDNIIDVATRLIQSIGGTSVVLAVIYFIQPEAIIGRWIFFISVIFLLFFLVSWRLLYTLTIKKRLFAEKAILLGSGELARDIMKEISLRRDVGYDVRMALGDDREKETIRDRKGRLENVPLRYGFDGICDITEAEEASSIIVALDQKRGVMPYRELLKCKLRGLDIIDGESFYERIAGKVLVEKINPSWLIFSDGFVKSRASRLTKRLVGLLLSSMMILMVLPIILVTALAIKLDSRGPVLFSQERVGEEGKIFTIYKFRSMKADAEKQTGPVWAGEDDPRITWVGKVIRKLRIDELPQLWNVLRGDMSFVGPRPERPFFVEKLKQSIPYYNERFAVKPGITGWAQIKYPYGASEEDALEKLKYDLYYIKNMSLVMDLMVIFHTVKIVLLGRGSR